MCVIHNQSIPGKSSWRAKQIKTENENPDNRNGQDHRVLAVSSYGC